jgi:hypothetical protein
MTTTTIDPAQTRLAAARARRDQAKINYTIAVQAIIRRDPDAVEIASRALAELERATAALKALS